MSQYIMFCLVSGDGDNKGFNKRTAVKLNGIVANLHAATCARWPSNKRRRHGLGNNQLASRRRLFQSLNLKKTGLRNDISVIQAGTVDCMFTGTCKSYCFAC
jgi:hypothetical protein